MMLLLVVISLLWVLVTPEPVPYKDCGSVKGKLNSVDLSPCPTVPCYLKKGGNMTLSVGFTPSENAPKLTAVVYGILAGIPIPFPIPNSNGCLDSGLVCPITTDKPYTYTAVLPVLSSYPSIKVVVKWVLKDENTDDIFCLVTPVEIGN